MRQPASVWWIVRALVAATALVAPLMPVRAREASACTCVGSDVLVADGIGFSDAVFAGTVTAVDRLPFAWVTVVTFRVDRVWKGDGDPVRRTWMRSSMCDFEVDEGAVYLVFASGKQHHPRIGGCGLVPLQTPDEASRYLSGGHTPSDNARPAIIDDPWEVLLLQVAGVGALAILTFLIVRRLMPGTFKD